MFKRTVSIFFTVLFLGIITAPTIIVSMDYPVDISIFFNISEEEEDTVKLKLVVSEIVEDTSGYSVPIKNIELGYQFKKHSSPFVNLISPPPDFIA